MAPTFNLREVRVYRPYPDEMPCWLLSDDDAGASLHSRADEGPQGAHARVAKLIGEVIGGYVVVARSPVCYELVNLVVAREFRRRGLGRWLLGHAIGLAESMGGRELVAVFGDRAGESLASDARAAHRAAGARAFLGAMDFRSRGPDLVLPFTPE